MVSFHKAFALLALTAAHAASAAPGPAPSQGFSAAEMQAADRIDPLTLPAPGELFAALGKAMKPSWASQYREPGPSSYPSRYQTALHLGALVADGFIAVEQQDGQQVKNIGRDIMALARTLGVSETVLARGKSIADFADNNEWGTLKEELEATENEVKLAMEEQQDRDLITLVSIGAWLRGTQAVTGVMLADYSPEAARLLRQPAIVAYLRSRIEALPPKVASDPSVRRLGERLAEIQHQVAFPPDHTPDREAVARLHATAGDLLRELAKRPHPPAP